jgi:hypothetical protein
MLHGWHKKLMMDNQKLLPVVFIRHAHVGILPGTNSEIRKNHSYFHSPIALHPFVGPWSLLQFRNLFTQSIGLLGREIRPSQGTYLQTRQHKRRINTHRVGFEPMIASKTVHALVEIIHEEIRSKVIAKVTKYQLVYENICNHHDSCSWEKRVTQLYAI